MTLVNPLEVKRYHVSRAVSRTRELGKAISCVEFVPPVGRDGASVQISVTSPSCRHTTVAYLSPVTTDTYPLFPSSCVTPTD